MLNRHQVLRAGLRRRFLATLVTLSVCAGAAHAQLFENLQSLGGRMDTTQEIPGEWSPGGPKGIEAGDLDADGLFDLAIANTDGTVAVFFGIGDGTFSARQLLQASLDSTLRDIVLTDVTADNRPDIIVTAPWSEKLIIIPNAGNRTFGEPRQLDTWFAARNLATGDFNGDGHPDLALAGKEHGLTEYHGTASGELRVAGEVPSLSHEEPRNWGIRPVYSLVSFRPPNASRDELVATHAYSSTIFVLREGNGSSLQPSGTLQGVGSVYYMKVGKIFRKAEDPGPPDLVTVNRDLSMVRIRRGITGPLRFESGAAFEMTIPSGPRAASIVDLDGDGWNDLVVVVRDRDVVLTYKNREGTLQLAHEMPVGTSPREVAAGDFNSDGAPDIAVINRWSKDVSILPAHPESAGFSSKDQIYLVDGDVVDLKVVDFNGDGRDDVLQVHRASADVSVRVAGENGYLARPTFYPMGLRPNALDIVDVNADGFLDLIVADLGVDKGSLAIRHGTANGSLGDLRSIELASLGGSAQLFGVLGQDFDSDGYTDLAVGVYDCSGSRILFLRGLHDGGLAEANLFRLPIARGMGFGDFDQDGDVDFAAVSGTGELAVVEIQGDVLSDRQLNARRYMELQSLGLYPTDLNVKDLNDDSDPDLLVSGAGGLFAYLGGAGTNFLPAEEFVDSRLEVSDTLTTDLDGDGRPDIAIACRIASCVNIFTQVDRNGEVEYGLALSVDVPSGRLLATGDVDGDGFPDLIGSGDVLWTALSSRAAESGGPPVVEGERERLDSVVINEIAAINNRIRLPMDGGRTPDWLEMFNGTSARADLGGWTLTLERANSDTLREFTIPETTSLESGERLVVIFSGAERSPLHTGFRLPGEGGLMTLRDKEGQIIDRVFYPRQFENVTYARFQDGVAAFTFTAAATPGLPNEYNSAIPPEFKFEHVSPPLRLRGEDVFFHGRARDDVGVERVTVKGRVTVPGQPDIPVDAPMWDVTRHDEDIHASGEANFLGGLSSALMAPGATVLEFYFEVTDVSGNVSVVPEDAAFDYEGRQPGFRLPLKIDAASLPRIEISEVVALNQRGLVDEFGGTPDWVEIVNCANRPVDLTGWGLSKRYPLIDADQYTFGSVVLAPGERYVVFCDGNSDQGAVHAPFSLSASKDSVFLLMPHADDSSMSVAVDHVHFESQTADVALARLQCGSEWTPAPPTPGEPNRGELIAMGDVDANGVLQHADSINILGLLFAGWEVICPNVVDVNDDAKRNISDAIYLLQHMFAGGAAPVGAPVPVGRCR